MYAQKLLLKADTDKQGKGGTSEEITFQLYTNGTRYKGVI